MLLSEESPDADARLQNNVPDIAERLEALAFERIAELLLRAYHLGDLLLTEQGLCLPNEMMIGDRAIARILEVASGLRAKGRSTELFEETEETWKIIKARVQAIEKPETGAADNWDLPARFVVQSSAGPVDVHYRRIHNLPTFRFYGEVNTRGHASLTVAAEKIDSTLRHFRDPRHWAEVEIEAMIGRSRRALRGIENKKPPAVSEGGNLAVVFVTEG